MSKKERVKKVAGYDRALAEAMRVDPVSKLRGAAGLVRAARVDLAKAEAALKNAEKEVANLLVYGCRGWEAEVLALLGDGDDADFRVIRGCASVNQIEALQYGVCDIFHQL